MSTHSFRFRVGMSLVLGLIWSDAALAHGLFAGAVNYAVGDKPLTLAIGDLDGDRT